MRSAMGNTTNNDQDIRTGRFAPVYAEDGKTVVRTEFVEDAPGAHVFKFRHLKANSGSPLKKFSHSPSIELDTQQECPDHRQEGKGT